MMIRWSHTFSRLSFLIGLRLRGESNSGIPCSGGWLIVCRFCGSCSLSARAKATQVKKRKHYISWWISEWKQKYLEGEKNDGKGLESYHPCSSRWDVVQTSCDRILGPLVLLGAFCSRRECGRSIDISNQIWEKVMTYLAARVSLA